MTRRSARTKLDTGRRYRDAGVDQVILLVVAGNLDRSAHLDALAKTIVEPAQGL
jgi:hypothetical protein